MLLKYQVGDIVKYRGNFGRMIGRIVTIDLSFIDEYDKTRVNLGLMDERDLYKNIYIIVERIPSYQRETITMNQIVFDEIDKVLFSKKFKPFNLKEDKKDMPICIKKIEECEKTETIKIPQHKAAPKIEERNYKIVKVTFTSGRTQEAVCMPGDTYDLSRGIEVCIMKELFGGTKKYNDFMRKCVKNYNNYLAEQKENEKEEELINARIAKNEKRKADLETRKKERERQEKIDIQAEAFLKAMNMYDKQPHKNFKDFSKELLDNF